jgi:hypothetical protein
MIAALLGLVLPIGATWMGLRAAGLRRASDSAAVTGGVACGLGLALAAAGTFLTLTLGGHLSPRYAVLDACVWLGLGVAAWRVVRRQAALTLPDRQAPRRLDTVDWCVRGAFVAVALAALAVVLIEYWSSPHGQWDAWAIWNQKARFMFRGGPGWTASLAVTWSAPSHPMFVSLAVARLWAYAGAELTAVPAGLSIVYGAALVALVVGALGTRTRSAWVAGTVVMAPFTFSHLVAAQTADLPLALFITASLVILRGGVRDGWDDPRATRTLALAGLLGGCAALTKNEGFVFLGASSVVVAWIALKHGRFTGAVWWAAGALPLAALMIWFKLTFAVGTPEYFTQADGNPGLAQRILDVDRLRLIGALTGSFGWRWGGSMTAGALLATTIAAISGAVSRNGRADLGLLWVVAVMVASYYAVWVLSPLDTTWLVGTTFDRLVAQVWPTLVIVAASAGRRD